MSKKRENAMGGDSAGYKASDLKNIRSLPDNGEYNITFDERRKIMTRTRKAGTDDQSKAIEQTRAKCRLAAMKSEEDELRLRISGRAMI